MNEVTLNEAETRAELIDPALKAAGWGGVEGEGGLVTALPFWPHFPRVVAVLA
ncbi:MAG: hypothetical protein U5K56_02855 [Halioglobus sp.]|nr:hypothetical protein [Halioglobus sp.]